MNETGKRGYSRTETVPQFREFGSGATWVDFPMTQDSAQTLAQAQIEALRWIAEQRNNEDADLDAICTRADHALTAAAEAGEAETFIAARNAAMWDAATIERCAQVVDGLAKKANRSEITKLEEAAAALRAMKDFSVIRMCVWSSCL